MRPRLLSVATQCALLATIQVARADDPEFKRSLETESDDAGWTSAGFRLSLGYAYGGEEGLGNLPGATTHNIIIRAGARLDAAWSLLGSLQYAFADGGFSALSYLITVDPTWHLGHGFDLAIGVGFGGLAGVLVQDPNDYCYVDTNGDGFNDCAPPIGVPAGDDFDIYADPTHSQTLTHSAPLESCSATGPAALVRVGWTLVCDDIWSLALHAETHARWMVCEESADVRDAETGERIVARQWWAMIGANLGLSFAWR